MQILIYIGIFWLGVTVGVFLAAFLFHRFRTYSGTIIVDTDDFTEKTVYSLVLDDYPEKLEFQKEVVFKVDSSHRNSDRE